jgi:protein-tyrosine phosphatase
MGNICRSPTAEGVLRAKLEAAGLADLVELDSAGTHDYHVGRAPDARSQRHALRRGYDLSALRARQVVVADFSRFDLVLAMDQANLSALRALHADAGADRLRLLMSLPRSTTPRKCPTRTTARAMVSSACWTISRMPVTA